MEQEKSNRTTGACLNSGNSVEIVEFEVHYTGSLKSGYPEIHAADGQQVTGPEYDKYLNRYLFWCYLQQVKEEYPEFGSFWEACFEGRRDVADALDNIEVAKQLKEYEEKLEEVLISYKCTNVGEDGMAEYTYCPNESAGEENLRTLAWMKKIPYKLFVDKEHLESYSDEPIVGNMYRVFFDEMPCGARTPKFNYIIFKN